VGDLLSDVQMKHVAAVLKAAIKAKGLTAKKVADKAGYNEKVVREMLGYGSGKPRKTVSDICLAIGIDLDAELRVSGLDASINWADNSIYRLFQTEKLKTRLDRLSEEYDKAEHPVFTGLVDRIVQKFYSDLDFNRQTSPAMTHQDFATHVSPYIKEKVTKIKAFSRSTVTDWRKLNRGAQLYVNAQRGKNVTRIFVLSSEAEFNFFKDEIFPAHEEICGAEKIFVCSEVSAAQLIDGRITREQDFAIFDDALVAFCSGNKVRIRIDNIVNVTEIFESFMLYFYNNASHNYKLLKDDPLKVRELFNKNG
jgi:DNA-binding phage protein